MHDFDATDELERAWKKTLAAVQPTINRGIFERFLAKTRPLSWMGREVTLMAPTEFALEWISVCYLNDLERHLSRELSFPIRISLRARPLRASDLVTAADIADGSNLGPNDPPPPPARREAPITTPAKSPEKEGSGCGYFLGPTAPFWEVHTHGLHRK